MCKKKEIKCNNRIRQYKKWLTLMILKKKNLKEHNPNWQQIPVHPHRFLTNKSCGSGKANSLFILIFHQPYVDKTHLYAKDPNETKYQLLINKRKSTRSKHGIDSKAFNEYTNDMDDI